MGWRNLTLATMLVLGISGCDQAPSRPIKGQPILASAPVETPADVVVAETQPAPVPDEPAAAIAAKPSSEQDDSFIPPFPENVDFFSPPEALAVEVEAVPEIAATEAQAAAPEISPPELRVIGFVQVAGEPPKAMLHLDGKLEVVAAGDELGDLSIVEVSEPSISVLRDGQQLQFALYNNSNAGQIAARQPDSQGERHHHGAWSRARGSGSNGESGFLPVPVDFDSLPGVPGRPSVEVPEINLPDVPQLSTVSE